MNAKIQPHHQEVAMSLAALIFNEIKTGARLNRNEVAGIMEGVTELVLEKMDRLQEALEALRKLGRLDADVVELAKSQLNPPAKNPHLELEDDLIEIDPDSILVNAGTANRGHGR